MNPLKTHETKDWMMFPGRQIRDCSLDLAGDEEILQRVAFALGLQDYSLCAIEKVQSGPRGSASLHHGDRLPRCR